MEFRPSLPDDTGGTAGWCESADLARVQLAPLRVDRKCPKHPTSSHGLQPQKKQGNSVIKKPVGPVEIVILMDQGRGSEIPALREKRLVEEKSATNTYKYLTRWRQLLGSSEGCSPALHSTANLFGALSGKPKFKANSGTSKAFSRSSGR